jgi:hypothetical protein
VIPRRHSKSGTLPPGISHLRNNARSCMRDTIYIALISILVVVFYIENKEKEYFKVEYEKEFENHWKYVYKTAEMIDKHHEKYGYDSQY